MRELFGGAMVADIPATLADASDFRVVPDNQECFMHPANGTCVIVELMERAKDVADVAGDCSRFFFLDLCKANDAVGAATPSAEPYHGVLLPVPSSGAVAGCPFDVAEISEWLGSHRDTEEATSATTSSSSPSPAASAPVSSGAQLPLECGVVRRLPTPRQAAETTGELVVPELAPPAVFVDTCLGWQRVAKFRESQARNDVFVGIGIVRIPAPYNTDVVVSVTAPQRVHPKSSDAKYVTERASLLQCTQLLRDIVASLRVDDFGLFVCS